MLLTDLINQRHLAILCLLVNSVTSSQIRFHASPPNVLEGLTDVITLHCSVNDTAASASVIGKRDVTITTDNVAEVSSVVIMKNGQDVASVSHAMGAHVMDGSTNTQVTGSVTAGSEGKGYLQLTIQNPTVNQTGEYTCESMAVSKTGHGVTFSTSLEVSSSAPTVADLVTYIRDLKQKYNDLQSKVDPVVVFSAGLTKSIDIPPGSALVYDRVFSNIGSGYDNRTGLFTCPVAGVYNFQIHALSRPNLHFWLRIELNDKPTVTMYCEDQNHHSCSNSVNLQLSKGDVVKVSTPSAQSELIFGHVTSVYTTFSGQLISVL